MSTVNRGSDANPLHSREISREIYPMPMFVRMESADIERASAWYQEVLGFANLYTLAGPDGKPMMAHLRWAKHADIMLVPERASGVTSRTNGASIYFTCRKGEVDQVAQAVSADAACTSGSIAFGPMNQPWNAREVGIIDPDGYTLVFAEGPVDESLTFDKVMERAGQSR